jgi:O-acetyl-ADP-ribose deacetylase (regulator of RNase III)
MLHVGGLAKIIVMKGGNNEIIQKESNANISKQGFKNSVPVGENIYTSGGIMKCKYVIHSVGPMWFGGEKNEFENLEKCFINIFKTSEKLKIESISIPAISTGIYGLPLGKFCEILFDSILNTFENENEKSLKEIRLTNIDEKTTNEIVKEFEKRFEK